MRNLGLDTLSGVFICFMVLLHYKGECKLANQAFDILLPFMHFFMAWFFYKSGMVFNRKRSVKETIYKSIKRLLIPFVYASIVGYAIWGLSLFLDNNLHINYLLNIPKELFWNGCLFGNGPVWFLFSLFVIQLLYSFFGTTNIRCAVIASILAMFAILFQSCEVNVPLYFKNICLGGLFFGVGTLMGFNFVPRRILVVAASILYFLIELFYPCRVSVVSDSSVLGNYYLWILSAFCGIFIYNYIATKYLKNGNLFSSLGKNTMPILLWHIPIFQLVKIIGELWLK